MSGDVYSDRNRELVTRVYQLGVSVFDKNRNVASLLMESILPLLAYKGSPLSGLKQEALKRQLGKRGSILQEATVYVYRILKGETIDSVAKDIPEFNQIPPEPVLPRPSRRKKPEESGASFHIGVRALEDRCY